MNLSMLLMIVFFVSPCFNQKVRRPKGQGNGIPGDLWDPRRRHKPDENGNDCFPASSLVTLEGGTPARMEDLKVGDSILTVEDGNVVFTPVLGFLNQDNDTWPYQKLQLSDGRNLYISDKHVFFTKDNTGNAQSKLVKDASIGDQMFVQDGENTTSLLITDISVEKKNGAYAPLTAVGTLVVDSVLFSRWEESRYMNILQKINKANTPF